MYVFFVVVVLFYPIIQEPYTVFMELGGKFEGKKEAGRRTGEQN